MTCLPALEVVLMWHRGNEVSKIHVSGYRSSEDSDSSETEVKLYHAARRYIPYDMNAQKSKCGSER
jgi:hypothetical protein